MRYLKIVSVVLLAMLLSFGVLAGCGKEAAPSAPENPTEENNSASSGSSDSEAFVGAFKTMDLDGNEVTESILAEKEYTMINLWGTYCGPCINEMPELEKIHQELPDNMQIIGIVCDYLYEVPDEQQEDVKAAADEIIKETGVTYPSLKIWATADWIYESSNVVPTTYFVDSEGKLVSDIIFGADVEGYRAVIEKLKK